MKKITFALAVVVIAGSAFSQTTRSQTEVQKIIKPMETRVGLDLASLSSKLVIVVKGLKTETQFKGLKDCNIGDLKVAYLEHTGKCLEFQSISKSSGQAPVVVVNADSAKTFADLTKAGARKSAEENYDWGTLSIWKSGSDQSIYLKPKNQNHMVKIGPVALNVLAQYKIQWSLELW